MLLLPVADLEGLGKLVKGEEFVVDDKRSNMICDDNVPTFHLQEGISNCTAEIAESVGLDSDDDLEEVSSSNVVLIVHFELIVELKSGIVLKTLSDVQRSVGVEKIQHELSFLLLCHQGIEVCYLFLLLFFHYLFHLFVGEVQLPERV